MIITPKDLNQDIVSEVMYNYGLGFNNSSLSFRKEHILKYMDYLREIRLMFDRFIGTIFLFTSQVIIWNEPLSIYRVLLSSASRKLESLDKFIQHGANFSRIVYEDYMTIYKAVKGSGFENILEKYINYQKIVVKLFSNDMKLTLRDVFNAVPLHNPKAPKWKILLAYFASILPYSLKKEIILKSLYKKQVKQYLKFKDSAKKP